MTQRDDRQSWNGFGETLARAFEIVVTPLVFALAGVMIDRWLGTGKVFAVALGVLALVGTGLRMYYGYVEEMKLHEAEFARARQRRTAT